MHVLGGVCLGFLGKRIRLACAKLVAWLHLGLLVDWYDRAWCQAYGFGDCNPGGASQVGTTVSCRNAS